MSDPNPVLPLEDVSMESTLSNPEKMTRLFPKPIIKRPAVFIAHHPIDPIQELVSESPN